MTGVQTCALPIWHKKGITLTTSSIAASNRAARHVFLWGLVLCGTVFGIFMWGWFIPHFKLGILFQILLAVSLSCQFLTGLITDTGGMKGKVHTLFAYGLGSLMMVMVLLIVLNPNVSSAVRIIDTVLAVNLAVLIVTSNILPMDSYMLRQQLFFAGFHLTILDRKSVV